MNSTRLCFLLFEICLFRSVSLSVEMEHSARFLVCASVSVKMEYQLRHPKDLRSVSHPTWPILLSNTLGRNGQCLAPHDYSITQKHISEKWSVSRPTWPVSLSNTPWRNDQCLAPHDYSIAQQHTGRNGQCLAPHDYSIAQQHIGRNGQCLAPPWLQYCSATP